MGKMFRFTALVGFVFFGVLYSPGFSQASQDDEASRNGLSFRSDYQQAKEPLILERVWSMAPSEWNPSERLWILARNTELSGLTSRPLKDDRFGVSADYIRSESRSYFSSELVGQAGLSDEGLQGFSCRAKPTTFEDFRFGTVEGARLAAGWASKAWDEAQNLEKDLIAVKLSKINEKTKVAALARGLVEWESARHRLEKQWREHILPRVKDREWKTYLEWANKAGVCKGQKASARVSKVETSPPDHEVLLLARGPARRWNGLFSVRLALDIGGRKLNGKFLIDSKADVSLVSPNFLSSQGIPPFFVETSGLPPEPIVWSGGREGAHQGRLGRHARFDSVELGGYSLPLREFLVADTEIFSPPENVSTCCDGVLGKDFLAQNVVELYPGAPAEVRLWSRHDFRPMLKQHEPSFALAVRAVPGEAPQVECASGAMGLNTGNQAEGKKSIKAGPMSCGQWQSELPAQLELGMAVLSLAPIIFDLPHGRVWLSEKLKTPGFIRSDRNQSGLKLKYDYQGSDRVLLVVALAKNSPAAALAKEGLHPGMVITEIDGKSSDEFDLWDIERKLSGDSGEQMTLAWEKKGPDKKIQKKLVPFRLIVK